MKNPTSKSYRYFFVFLNMAMLVCTVVFIGIGVTEHNLLVILFPGFGTLIILIYSTFKIYFKTGVWRFVHSNSEDMDERELALARMALQKAYTVFSVTILVFITALAIALSFDFSAKLISQKSSALMFIVVGFIYFAHSLPAAFIVLRERYLDFH
ncbi:hypothetical protein ACFL2X_07525 [Candidatus Latescibacterota bacterium]